jgi:hypothetical protein
LIALTVQGRQDAEHAGPLRRSCRRTPWFVPLVLITGGPSAYFKALAMQGNVDSCRKRMLWDTRTRQLITALTSTFIAPWATTLRFRCFAWSHSDRCSAASFWRAVLTLAVAPDPYPSSICCSVL